MLKQMLFLFKNILHCINNGIHMLVKKCACLFKATGKKVIS